MINTYLHLNSRDEFLRIDLSKVVYFESEGNYTNIMLCNSICTTVCMNLAQMQNLLSENLKENARIFARVGKRHIINLNYVYQVSVLRQKLQLTDGLNFSFTLDISKDALKKLKELYVKSATRINNK